MCLYYKEFYNLLEKDISFDFIEFRLRYKKALLKYMIIQCPKVKNDIEMMINNYQSKKDYENRNHL